MRKTISLLVAIWAMCIHTAYAQFQERAKFKVEETKLSDSKIRISFTGEVENGWHLYGTDVPEGGPTRTELTLETRQGVKPVGELRTQGKIRKGMDPVFQMEVTTIEGNVTFSQEFEITEPAYHVAGYLTYGACNNQSCSPPTYVEFEFKGEGKPAVSASGQDAVPAKGPSDKDSEEAPATDDLKADTTAMASVQAGTGQIDWWKPVTAQLQQLDNASDEERGLMTVFLLGMLGGFVALLTPCVWPIIPMTVSFFLKRSQNRKKGILDAMLYGLSIVVIYVGLGLLVSATMGASTLNSMSTNAVFNIFFFLMLLFFAASFLGGFELTLPSSWTTSLDKKSENVTGLLSIFLMAFTLSLVSFSCTGPIIGFLLVEVSSTGSLLAPTMGMLGFAVALALPFTLFALFPTWLNTMPKSGNWMNCVKVCLGFIELAFALKFLSVADLAYGWHILDREVFLSLWIIIFALMGAYLIGWIRFPHDEEEYDEMGEVVVHTKTGVTRFFLALISFSFALYMVPGLWGAPCKAVSAFAPPMNTQDFNLYKNEVEVKFHSYEEGMEYAKAHRLPVMVDFSGYGCVNCRKMEASVWTDSKVTDLLNKKYVLITLIVDDKTPLPEQIVVEENGTTKKLRTIGDKWSYLQRTKFGANAQPFYVLLDNEGEPLAPSYAFNEDVQDYVNFLEKGLQEFEKRKY